MVGQKVFVYWNLHKKKFSVKDVKIGRVILHADRVLLKDATFKVSQAGRKRVLEQKRKNVHAGVQGVLKGFDADLSDYPHEAYYNPYQTERFIDKQTGEPVYTAPEVLLVNKRVFFR